MDSNIGSIIKNARIAQGLTQKKLSEKICTPRHLSNIEHNRCVPNVELAQALFSKLQLNSADYQLLCTVSKDEVFEKSK